MRTEDRRPQGGQIETPLSVLMADIVNSTSLYEDLGDLRARELVGSGMEVMSATIERHGGRLIKSLGDGILACFEDSAAATAALEISEQVSSLTLEVRVGVHYGSVIDDGVDIFGDTVNTTARLASAARPSEVLFSKQVWDQIPAKIRERGRSIPSITVKGKREPVEVFSIITDCGEYATTLVDDHKARHRNAPSTSLELTLEGKQLRLEGEGNLLIGRGQECDLRIEHDKTSRTHARIFYRAPAFVLEDSSTNGTTVVQDSGAKALIHRRKTVLIGRGKIYAGATPGTANAQPIGYRVS